MNRSEMTTKFIESPNHYNGRKGYKICKFTPHHMAGILTCEQCANIFRNPNRNASSNYCIGNNGELVCCVDEENGAWTSSNMINDCQAITVEVSNCEIGGEWRISDKAWNTLVNLAVDVCKRYNFRLVYDGTPNGSLTTHRMFAATACPGEYLNSKMQLLAQTVNEILDGKKENIEQIGVKIEEKINVKYQVYNGTWLPNVINSNNTSDGYAGIYGTGISGFRGNTVGKVEDVGKLIYKVHSVNGIWHDEVIDREKDKNGDDYAGILGKKIDGIAIKSTKGIARYRAHVINGNWLPWVNGYNIGDNINGYAGNFGQVIDGIQIEII